MIWGWIPAIDPGWESKPIPSEVNRHRYGTAVEIGNDRILVTVGEQCVVVSKNHNILSFKEIDDGKHGLSNQSVYIASKNSITQT